MKRFLIVLAMMAGAWIGSARDAGAQTRADTAAVLLNAAERLRLQGDASAARALLDMIARDYPGTPSAAQVEAMLAIVRRMPVPAQSGRTELMVWGATYGAWLGIAIPWLADAEKPEAYGIGLLLGAPAGFFAARGYGARRDISEGQARAITFGGTWGTFQGLGWMEVFDVGAETIRSCPVTAFDDPCVDVETSVDGSNLIGAAVVGGLAGIATGAMLAGKPISAGTATAVSHGGLWGAWFGFGLAYVAGGRDDDNLAATLLGGNVALLTTALLAPSWRLSESRARLISIAGVVGGIAGAGIALIAQPDEAEVALAIPLATSAVGLALGARYTRNDVGSAEDTNGDRGALLNLARGHWTMTLPEPALRLQRLERSVMAPSVYVPLLHARF